MIGWPAAGAGPVVYLVSDRRLLSPDDASATDRLGEWLDRAIDAGADAVQIREPDLSARDLTALTVRAVRRAGGGRTLVLVNERADVARAAGAGGVHLRSDGPAIARVREIGGPGWVVGRATHSVADVAAAADADYVLFGPVFPTASKPGVPAAGVDRLREAVRKSRQPVIAIGGINPENAGDCIAAGAAGIAAIGLFATPATAAGPRLGDIVNDLRERIRLR